MRVIPADRFAGDVNSAVTRHGFWQRLAHMLDVFDTNPTDLHGLPVGPLEWSISACRPYKQHCRQQAGMHSGIS